MTHSTAVLVAAATVVLNFWQGVLGEEARTRAHKVNFSPKSGRIKRNTRNDKTDSVSFRLAQCNSAQNTMSYCHGNVTLLHSLTVWKHKHNPCAPAHIGSWVFHINKVTFVSSGIEFNLLWFCGRRSTHTLLWVPSSQKSLVGRTAIWQRIIHRLTGTIDALRLNWHGLVFAFPVSPYPPLYSNEKMMSITE